jgi:hypothetical protein
MSEFPSSSLAGHYRALALDAYAAARLMEDPHEKLTMQHIVLSSSPPHHSQHNSDFVQSC